MRLQPPPDGLSDQKAWPKRYFRLQPRVSDRGSQKPCSPLFSDWRDQSRLGPSDWGHPLRRDQGQTEKAAHESNRGIGTIPYTPVGTVLDNRPDTNSIVGADIWPYSIVGAIKLPYGKKTVTCLWASIVL